MITLKNVLLVNGISSGFTGFLLVIFSNPVARLFGVSQPSAISGVGIFLLVFAALVMSEGLRSNFRANVVKLIIVLDVVWVVVSFAVVALQLFNLSAMGSVAVGAVAGWVALMAYFQFKGLVQIIRA